MGVSYIKMTEVQSNIENNLDESQTVSVCKKIIEEIPDYVSYQVVREVLSHVADSDWNDPLEVSKTIGRMMTIDVNSDISSQSVTPFDIPRTVLTQAKIDDKKSDIPYWICQSLIRVDEKNNNRYIEHDGAVYNKIDIIFHSDYFKNYMDRVAKHAKCTWNARWGNATETEHRLYQKTRNNQESWLDKCVEYLIVNKEPINIKDIVMIEFKKAL
jgi:hypothetical protein